MERKTKVVEGISLSGEKRKYTFQIMDAHTGLLVFHEYSLACFYAAPILTKAIPIVVRFQKKLTEAAEKNKAEVTFGVTDMGTEALELLRFAAEVLTPNRLNMICKQMLAGCKVEYEGGEETIGESGVGEYTAGDPLEVYFTLFHAIQANFPKVLGPLSQMVSIGLGLADDLTQDTDTATDTTEENSKK